MLVSRAHFVHRRKCDHGGARPDPKSFLTSSRFLRDFLVLWTKNPVGMLRIAILTRKSCIKVEGWTVFIQEHINVYVIKKTLEQEGRNKKCQFRSKNFLFWPKTSKTGKKRPQDSLNWRKSPWTKIFPRKYCSSVIFGSSRLFWNFICLEAGEKFSSVS